MEFNCTLNRRNKLYIHVDSGLYSIKRIQLKEKKEKF